MELGGGQVLTRGERKEWSGRKTRSLMGGAGVRRIRLIGGVFGLAGPRRLMELGDRLVMFHYVRVCLG